MKFWIKKLKKQLCKGNVTFACPKIKNWQKKKNGKNLSFVGSILTFGSDILTFDP